MRLLLTALLVAFTFACNEAATGGSPQVVQGPPGPQGPAGPAGKFLAVDGSRYKITQPVLTGPDGSLWQYGLPRITDLTLGVDCTVVQVDATHSKCIPQPEHVSYLIASPFSDAGCTLPVAIPKPGAGTDDLASTGKRLFRVSNTEYTGTLYTLTQTGSPPVSQCGVYTSGTPPYYALTEVTDFLTLTIQ